GRPPYTLAWTRVTFTDGVPSIDSLGTDPSVTLIMGSVPFHLVLDLEDAKGKAVGTSRLVAAGVTSTSPPPPPPPTASMVVTIVGDTVAAPGVPARWSALVQGGGSTGHRTYTWTRTSQAPGGVAEVVGTRADLGLDDLVRTCVLSVSVTQDGGSG